MTAGDVKNHLKRHKLAYGLLAAGLAVVAVLGLWFNTAQTKIDTMAYGVGQEKTLTALHNSVQIDLGLCLDKSAQTANITTQEYNSLKGILVANAQARYVDANGRPTRASTVLGGAQFISALQESNPLIDLSGWKTLVSVVDGCRDNVAGDQTHLQIMAADFQTWTQGGGVFFTHGWRGTFPDQHLKVIDPVARQVMTGYQALTFLLTVISTTDASQAIHSGVMPSQTLFPSSGASAPTSSAPSTTSSSGH